MCLLTISFGQYNIDFFDFISDQKRDKVLYWVMFILWSFSVVLGYEKAIFSFVYPLSDRKKYNDIYSRETWI